MDTQTAASQCQQPCISKDSLSIPVIMVVLSSISQTPSLSSIRRQESEQPQQQQRCGRQPRGSRKNRSVICCPVIMGIYPVLLLRPNEVGISIVLSYKPHPAQSVTPRRRLRRIGTQTRRGQAVRRLAGIDLFFQLPQNRLIFLLVVQIDMRQLAQLGKG